MAQQVTEYDDYFSPEMLAKIKISEEQFERGECISFSMEELTAMETGEIPQRGIDFLKQHGRTVNL
ncbi:MAG: hypothetical protein FWG64_11965 [Firmicutes bacterium]|nr:hypothetical protein [Bacillota bacterium]